MSELQCATLYIGSTSEYKHKGARTPGGEVVGIKLPDATMVLPEAGSLFEVIRPRIPQVAMLAIRGLLFAKKSRPRTVSSVVFGAEMADWQLDSTGKSQASLGMIELMPKEGINLIGGKSFVTQEGGVYGVVDPHRYLLGLFLGTGRQNRSLGVDGCGRLIYGATDAFVRTFPGAPYLSLYRLMKPPKALKSNSSPS